jgi:hypothetical protein
MSSTDKQNNSSRRNKIIGAIFGVLILSSAISIFILDSPNLVAPSSEVQTLTPHQQFCQNLMNKMVANSPYPHDKYDDVLYAIKLLLDQDVNKTVSPDLTTFRNNCMSDSGNGTR